MDGDMWLVSAGLAVEKVEWLGEDVWDGSMMRESR
jgi:hypothetical protein